MTKEAIRIAREKAGQGVRLSLADALALYEDNDLLFLAECARKMKEKKSGRQVFYNVNKHINLTNICISDCPLCAFRREKGQKGGYVLEKPDIEKILEEAKNTQNLGEIHIVSALHPDKPFEYYLDVVRMVRQALPQVDIKAFTPVEIVHFSQMTGKSIRKVLEILKEAGLSSLPGGGAEILDDAVRQKICPRKASTDEWIETIKTAHKMGIRTNCTMMYGHVETIEQRLQHLALLRDIQDETGGFQAFVSFPFHPANTGLSHLKRVGSWEDMKMLALSRLVLDNIDHIKAFWIMLTMPLAQLALGFGADDLDGTIGEEKIIHAAGADTGRGITRSKLRRLIAEAGFEPVERDTFYHPVEISKGKEDRA